MSMSLTQCNHNRMIPPPPPPHPCSTLNIDKTVEISASNILAYTLSNCLTLDSAPGMGFFSILCAQAKDSGFYNCLEYQTSWECPLRAMVQLYPALGS